MKKIMSLLLAVIMLFGLIPATAVTATATGGTAAEGLVFELDLSGYDAASSAANKGITNKAKGNSSGITVYGTSAPALETVLGDKKALVFKTTADEAGTNNRAITVQDTDFYNKEEMTIEFWLKGTEFGTSTKSYRLFTMSSTPNFIDAYGYQGGIWWRPGGTNITGFKDYRYQGTDYAAQDEQWAHYVYTRKWTSTSANDGTGQWSGDLYINGEHISLSSNKIEGVNTFMTKPDEADAVFAIGNNGSKNAGFYGSIADVRVYTTVLSEASIVQKYIETKGEFVEFEHTQAKVDGNVLAKTEESQNLDVKAGEIELEFTEPVADDDLNKIQFTKLNGDPISGTTVTKSGASVIVSYPALELGANYKLIVPNNLTASLGETIKAGATYIFTGIVDEKLVFDLDLSGYNASGTGAKGIVNTVEGGNSTITVNGTPAAAAIGSFTTKKALDFTPTTTTNPETGAETITDKNRGIKVADSDFISQDEMTIEFWLKGTEFGTGVTKDSRLFFMSTSGYDSTSSIDIYVYHGRIFYRPGGSGTGFLDRQYKQADFTEYNNKWSHFVFTRKWTPAAANDGTGQWSGDLYINGTKLTNVTDVGNTTTYAKRSEENAYIQIGNRNTDVGFYGSIADVRVYNTVLSDVSIAQKYTDTKGEFVEFEHTQAKADGKVLAKTEGAQNLDVKAGIIDLEFTESVADADLNKIQFTKANGDPISGTTVTKSGTNVIVSYPTLEAGVNYKLVVPNNLTASLGETIKAGATYIFTGTVDEKLVFDLDLSGYDAASSAATKGIVNKVTGNDSKITVNGTPEAAVIDSITNKKALTFKEADNAGDTNSRGIKVEDTDFLNQDEMTIEFWLKGTEFGTGATVASRLFFMSTTGYDGTSSIDVYVYNGRIYYRPGGSASGFLDRQYKQADFTEYNNKWSHFVFTRKWTPAAANDGTGQWSGDLYINGTKLTNVTDVGNTTTYAKRSEENAYIRIGNKNTGDGFYGSIADVKIYNTVLSDALIAQKYENTRETFYRPVPGIDNISFKNQNEEEIDDETVLLKDATSVTATAEITNCPEGAIGFLALYSENGDLQAVEKATVGEANSDAVTEMQATLNANRAHKAVFYIWSDLETMEPVFSASSIGGKIQPLKIAAEFCDGSGQAIEYAKDKNGLTANLNLTAGTPPENLSATLRLIRNKGAIYENSANIVFANGEANVNLVYAANADYPVLPTMQVDDELVLTVTNGEEVLFEKRLPYEDQSKIVDVILVAGQSNALGQGGDATLSIKPDADTVYYNTMGNKTLSTSGNQGWDSALAKTWHEETGRIVLLVKATWGGTGFPTIADIDSGNMYTTGSRFYGLWNPDNGMPLTNTSSGATVGEPDTYKPRDCYTHAKNAYNTAIASIDTSKYTIGRKIYFWNQGENENGSYTPALYKEAFLEMHNALKTDLGLEYAGILPVRSTILSNPQAGAQNTKSAETTLRLTGPRIAQYHLGATRNDVFIVADTMERWSSNDAIKQWFEDKYADGYPWGDENMPTGWSTIMASDNIHYNQYALNEFGPEAAKNMLNFIRGGGSTVDGIDLITPFGIEHVENGGTISLPAKDGANANGDGWNATLNGVIPVMPASSGIKGTFTLSENTVAELTAEGLLAPKACLEGDYSILTVSYTENGIPKTMSFRVVSPIRETSVSIEIAPVFENRPAIYTLTTDDGYKATTEWLTKKLTEIETEAGLSANTLKATMGLVPAYMGVKNGVMTWAESQSYAALDRWGVANHTQNHKQTDFNTLSEEVLKQEINGGRTTLKSYFPNEKIIGLYTPGGHNSDLIRKVAAEQHFSLRGVAGSHNQLPLTDQTNTTSKTLYNLSAPLVIETTTVAKANEWVDSAIASGKGWLIECWHCVGNDVGYSPVPEAIAEEHLEYVAQKAKAGQLWVTTLDEASVYAKQRIYTRLSLKPGTNVAEGTIIFGVEDDLDDTLYDATLTVNITLPDGWTNATATQNGENLPVTIANGKISVNTLPGKGNITITKVS